VLSCWTHSAVTAWQIRACVARCVLAAVPDSTPSLLALFTLLTSDAPAMCALVVVCALDAKSTNQLRSMGVVAPANN
jgi:hypothetical protein